jgi:hypothetical protein
MITPADHPKLARAKGSGAKAAKQRGKFKIEIPHVAREDISLLCCSPLNGWFRCATYGRLQSVVMKAMS